MNSSKEMHEVGVRAFLSYSRSDEVQALMVAQKIRAIGVQLWVDKLDIRAGEKWDSAIQSALQNSTHVIVLLSQEAVASENVLDEIGLALDDKKTIIPLLLKPCDRPLRIRRIQYIDCTSDLDHATLLLSVRLQSSTCFSPAEKLHIRNHESVLLNFFQKRVRDALRFLAALAICSFITGSDISKSTSPNFTRSPNSENNLMGEVLRIAGTQLDVREMPLGSNGGPEVDKYLKSVGLPTGNPWSAAFIYWCFDRAAYNLSIENPLTRSASFARILPVIGSNGFLSVANAIADPDLIRPGMVFLINFGGGQGHVGIVEGRSGDFIETIEGNVNDFGGREGVGVFRMRRRISAINGGFWAAH